jgi:hypothetical protein
MDLPICWIIGGKRYCSKAQRELVVGATSGAARLHSLADRSVEEREALDRREADISLFEDVALGKEYFTYEEFLTFSGYPNDADLRAYFDK